MKKAFAVFELSKKGKLVLSSEYYISEEHAYDNMNIWRHSEQCKVILAIYISDEMYDKCFFK